MSAANLMSAFRNVFGTGPAPAVQPIAQQQQQVANQPVIDPNNQQGNKEDPKPLDNFANLWEPPKPKDGDDGKPQPLFSHTPEALLETARKINFVTAPTTEQLESINKGGAEAFQVFQSMMNDAAQKAFAQGADASTKLITSALDRSKFVKADEVATHIKKSKVSESLREDNPIFSNPAIAPIMAGLEQQILLKHPDATASQITAMAKDYFSGVSELFTAPDKLKQQQEESKKKGETDWSNFV